MIGAKLHSVTLITSEEEPKVNATAIAEHGSTSAIHMISPESSSPQESVSRSKSISDMNELQQANVEVRKSFMQSLDAVNSQTELSSSIPKAPQPRLENAQSRGSIHAQIEDSSPNNKENAIPQSPLSSSNHVATAAAAAPSAATSSSTHTPSKTAPSRSPSDASKPTKEHTGETHSTTMLTQVQGTPNRRTMYLAETSALEFFMVRHLTVVKLHPLVAEHFTHSDLVDVVRIPKQSFWSRFLSTLKPNKKQAKPKGNPSTKCSSICSSLFMIR